jgi:hypothetical protein
MFVQAWRFVTVLLTALLLGMTFCHVLEMPAKMRYDAALYLTLHRTLDVAFGPPNVGPFIEIGAVVASIALTVLLRRRTGFWLALIGTACLIGGVLVYFAEVEPANAALRTMSIESPAQDWEMWRAQWEWGHTAHFALDLLGFCALLASALARSSSPIQRGQRIAHEPQQHAGGR